MISRFPTASRTAWQQSVVVVDAGVLLQVGYAVDNAITLVVRSETVGFLIRFERVQYDVAIDSNFKSLVEYVICSM